ncbi:MAG: 2,3,4,5-tetrahydropyridine-2,6-dicarboxylate N-succinyltransferase [Oleiphilus sp.]|nr:MAG: 2,3,4,5-tetrahydropyridine-2,6-dicarboxylate N-succinyltransferase [Oleiphilus sp.]
MTIAFGLGLGTKNLSGDWLETFFPAPVFQPSAAEIDALRTVLDIPVGNQTVEIDTAQMSRLSESDAINPALKALATKFSGSAKHPVIVIIDEDTTATSTPEVYLKLHLLSHCLVKPHGINLDGIFGLLPNLAWTNEGPIDLEELPERQLQARLDGRVLEVKSVDKFPQMTDYTVPSGVRIADTARVRLGAYIGTGTTIMHEGFVNFNAGTEGASMIEGRISAGVMVGKGSDLGGGCSTMGTLSGGGNIVISVGENSLIGANAGIGIPLGNRCTVESGLYITAGTKVTLIDNHGDVVESIKARDLAGKDDLLFRRNSTNGRVECLSNQSAVELNEALHANN